MNASGIDTMPGFSSGNSGRACFSQTPWGPITAGPTATSSRQELRPTSVPTTAPAVVKLLQYMESSKVGRLALAAMAKASPTRKATFWPRKPMPSTIATAPIPSAVRRATRTSRASSRSAPCRSTPA